MISLNLMFFGINFTCRKSEDNLKFYGLKYTEYTTYNVAPINNLVLNFDKFFQIESYPVKI